MRLPATAAAPIPLPIRPIAVGPFPDSLAQTGWSKVVIAASRELVIPAMTMTAGSNGSPRGKVKPSPNRRQ